MAPAERERAHVSLEGSKRNMINKQHREIETSLSLVLCCLFSYSKISKRLEGVAYKLLLINHTACKN